MPKALVIGAGNIGRGFLAEILIESGYEITFCDVNETILNAIQKRGEYKIIYAGTKQEKTISGFTTVNSSTEKEKYLTAVKDADLVMTAIGVNLLPRISRQLAEAMNSFTKPRVLMACENAIRATSQWKLEMDQYLSEQSKKQTLFVDVAVDRIVPNIRHENGDVSVEQYKEMVVDRTILQSEVNLKGIIIAKQGLDPYISRKLFCVNAAHAYVAWLGIKKGHKYIHEALKDPEIHQAVKNLLNELTDILQKGYGLEKAQTSEYCRHVLIRFANEALQDTVERVGRGVMRKLSANDRFVTPIRIAVEHNLRHDELLKAIKAACEIEVPNDEESTRLHKEIKEKGLIKALFDQTKLFEEILRKIKD